MIVVDVSMSSILDDYHKSPEKNESSKLESCYCQKAILTPSELHEHGLFIIRRLSFEIEMVFSHTWWSLRNLIIVHLSGSDDGSVKKACQQLSYLKQSLLQLHPDSTLEATLGLGYAISRKWLAQATIPFPKSFIPYKERKGPTGKYMPSTGNPWFSHWAGTFSAHALGGDLFLDIRSDRKDLCFELGRQFYQLISDKGIAQLENTFGFAYMSSKTTGLAKDFIGFEDGNDNPEGYRARVNSGHDECMIRS